MPLAKYRIYELSTRAVISYGREQDGVYTFHLSAAETEKCKSLSAPHEQDDNALFYQIMCVLHGDAFTETPGGQLVTDLSDVIFYMDFSGIFDRSGARKKHLIRQEKAKALFRPEGVSLDFGSGPHRYLAFERSGSMSRQARLSFIREDFYDAVRRRIMMDMTIGDCQLSKLYAYNGLMLSSGIRIDGIGIDRPHRVVVIDNPTRTERNVSVITVEDDGTQSSTSKYRRVEKKEDIEITCFDGEGLISKEYARVVDEKLCGKKVHTSFQIRMPYVKGMLHEVDFKDFLTLCGTDTITDLWGMEHSVRDVDVILTKSMFKGYGWLTASGMNWEDYRTVFRKYRHALYITNVSKEKPEQTTELNYQFLTTVSIQGDEFRPADLPDGWDHSPESSFYAPQAAYAHDDACTLLRNPHIARNEELQLSFYDAKEERKQMRHYYFGHLTDVVMVDSNMLAAERLGGADYDGDMIKTISDSILNACVRRNYNLYRYEKHKSLTNTENIPLLMIPTAQPQIRSADDWEARFETVRSTFSSRVGQICNAALDRSIIAYNENSDAEERARCREETETLAILTGLEIDSAKSGIRPDLDEYLTHKAIKRSDFLKYKTLVEEMETRRAWYEPTHASKVKTFFKKVDWSKVDSNVERLPYLAQQLKKNTPRIKATPARDEELFSFAQQPDWKRQLNSDKLAAVDALLRDHDACLSRIRACRVPVKEKKRKSDVERILYARGQEDTYDPDELYALFGSLPLEKVSALLYAMREQAWHLMDGDARERFLREWLPEPEFEDIYDLLTDFRFGGYRILGDIVCDMEDENTGREKKQLFRESDSKAFTAMMRAFADKSASRSYRDAVTAKCRELLTTIVRPTLAVRYVVALGRRDLLWELLPEYIEKNVLEVWDD